MRDRPLTLVVFVDALGWAISRRFPLLEGVLTAQGPMDSVLGYSSTCIPTILTGLMPRDHGHFSFFHYDPQRSPFKGARLLRLLPKGLADRGRVRHLISRGVGKALGYTGYFQLYNVPFEHLPLFDYGEKLDLYQPGGIHSGAPTIFDALRRRGVPLTVSDWRLPEEENLKAMAAALRAPDRPSFAYLYLADLDGILHAHGATAAPVAEKIRWYDTQLRELLRVAEANYSKVRLHLFSDHGMTDVSRIVDLQAAVQATGLRFGQHYVAMYDATMARFWLLDEAARAPLTRCLGGARAGRILTEGEIAAYGLDFPDGRQGDLLYLVEPGALICPSFMGLKPVAGMHGYEPTDGDSLALYGTNAPGAAMPRSLTDLFPLLLAEAEGAMGRRAEGDGSAEAVA